MPTEFLGLKPKMYSLEMEDGKEKSTAKGVKRSHAQKHIKHQQYKACLFDKKETTATFHTLQSKNHKIKTEKLTKIALSCYDDKRFLLPDNINSLAYGHVRIPNKAPKRPHRCSPKKAPKRLRRP